ncbi:ATP-binding protein [Brevibacterium sp. GP-SGM9]|uniref:sensor histidine kinase n=1 Tax=Brevibacterium sp. GP-SGM9 TaxID=3376990 RepID=UPI0039A53938
MTNFLVIEVQIWLFLLLLFLVLAGLAVAAWFGWRYLKKREARQRESIESAAAEDSLAKRNRMLIRLDHELKNPLTALRTSAASIREVVRDGGTITEVEPSAKQVDVSSRRVARLLADLRKLADVETRIIEYARVDLDALIHQAVEDASTAPGAEDRMIVATVARAPWRLPDVAGEEDLLLTAILNLLGNALKYSSQAEVVELRANEQIIDGHRWVVVEVADTGSGIPLAEQEGVWDELSRGSRVRAVAGSGMGLSLVRAIVTRHGGSVQLFSQEGVGTSVRMVLPVLGDAAQVTVPQMGEHMDRVAAGSHPVQPVQLPDSRQSPGFLPPRQPSEDELQGRILGTPRRTSKRRLERVDGNLVHRSTGESVSGGFPPDSGQHSQFKPGPGVPRGNGYPGGQPNGPNTGGQQPNGPQSGGQGPSGPQTGGQQPNGPHTGGQQPNGQQPSHAAPQQPYQQNSAPPEPSQPQAGQYQSGHPQSGQTQAGQPQSAPHQSGQPQSGPQPPQPQQWPPPPQSGPPAAPESEPQYPRRRDLRSRDDSQ